LARRRGTLGDPAPPSRQGHRDGQRQRVEVRPGRERPAASPGRRIRDDVRRALCRAGAGRHSNPYGGQSVMTILQSATSPRQTLAPTALKALARRAQGMTGADIERWVRDARQKARRDRRPLSYADLESQLAGSKPSRSTALRMRIATHEAGHAVARMLVGFGPIAEISVDAKMGG